MGPAIACSGASGPRRPSPLRCVSPQRRVSPPRCISPLQTVAVPQQQRTAAAAHPKRSVSAEARQSQFSGALWFRNAAIPARYGAVGGGSVTTRATPAGAAPTATVLSGAAPSHGSRQRSLSQVAASPTRQNMMRGSPRAVPAAGLLTARSPTGAPAVGTSSGGTVNVGARDRSPKLTKRGQPEVQANGFMTAVHHAAQEAHSGASGASLAAAPRIQPVWPGHVPGNAEEESEGSTETAPAASPQKVTTPMVATTWRSNAPQATIAAKFGGLSGTVRKAEPFVAIHHAAARIQRAWKVSRWRRAFVDYSAQQGWVGSLSWLQQRNMLYGTELADDEDVRTWESQRAVAPMDREVDPWGYERLQNHLHRMWWGRDSEEMEQTHHMEAESCPGYSARTREETAVSYEAPVSARRGTTAASTRLATAREPAVQPTRASSSHAAPAAERLSACPQPCSSAGSARGVPPSPRRKVSTAGDTGKAVGYSRSQAVGHAWNGGPGAATMPSVVLPSARAYRSPPQTQRAMRTSTPMDAVSAAAVGAAMRRAPLTTVWTHRASPSSD